MLARTSRRHTRRRKTGSGERRGNILVLAAAFMVVMMAVLAFCVDLAYITTSKVELKRATDAAALAGAGSLIEGTDAAELGAFEFLVRNPIGRRNLAADENWQDNLSTLLAANQEDFAVEVGHWDPDSLTFSQSNNMPSTVRVTATHRNVPLFFGNMFRERERVYHDDGTFVDQAVPIDLTAESIARYQPRDIVVVLDLSGSMNDDSEFKRLGSVSSEYREETQALIEANMLEIYNALQQIPNPPDCGSLPFEPAYPRIVGEPPADPRIPQIHVTFGTDEHGTAGIFVESTKDLSNVVIQTADGSIQKFEGLSGYTGTFTGTNADTQGERIVRAWVKSGNNASGEGPGYGERLEPTDEKIAESFGLDQIPYPYQSGSWDNFIDYCQGDYDPYRAGYRRMYGWMNLINYWLENKPGANQTADLWRVPAQPVQQVKDAVGVFLDYVQEVDTEDRVSLVVYNSSSEEALVEHSLTEDFAAIATTTTQRQAGHYNAFTNIGDGIRYARQELEANARTGAFKMIVLMTDGQANRPSGVDADQYALNQAALVAAKHWPIVCISLGSGADVNLMDGIASLTGGVNFEIQGGATITDYEAQLTEAFRSIADHRPLVLVK